MSDRTRLAAASLYLAVFVAGGIGILWVVLRYGLTSSQQLVFFGYTGYAVVGYAVLRRQPANSIAWWFMLAAALGGILGLAQTLTGVAINHHDLDSAWAVAAGWLQNVLWVPLLAVSVTFPMLVFPSGLYASPPWRRVGWATGILCLVFVVTNGLSSNVGSVFDRSSRPNPLSPAFMDRFGDADHWALNPLLQLAVVVLTAAAAIALVRRGQRADGDEREQVRWFALGASILVAALLINAVLGWLLGDSHLAAVTGNVLLAAGLAMVPVCMGVAILRFRLYDIDRLISRTAAYTVVTAVVLATYAAVVTFVTTLLPDKTSALPVAIATLTAAAVFRPLLQRVQAAIDRRFDREKYDAQRVVDEFGERLRSETDTETTLAELVAVVTRTVAPSAVAVWLLSASTRGGDAVASRGGGPSV